MDRLLQFLTSSTVPWWSGLLGVLAGGLLTQWVTSSNEKRRVVNDERVRIEERKVQARMGWFKQARADVLGLLSESSIHHRAGMTARYELFKDPDALIEPVDSVVRTQQVADQYLRLQQIVASMQVHSNSLDIAGAGDLAKAAHNLVGRSTRLPLAGSKEDFDKWYSGVLSAQALLLTIAYEVFKEEVTLPDTPYEELKAQHDKDRPYPEDPAVVENS